MSTELLVGCLVVPETLRNGYTDQYWNGVKIIDLEYMPSFDKSKAIFRGNYWECEKFAKQIPNIDYIQQPCGHVLTKKDAWW